MFSKVQSTFTHKRTAILLQHPRLQLLPNSLKTLHPLFIPELFRFTPRSDSVLYRHRAHHLVQHLPLHISDIYLPSGTILLEQDYYYRQMY